MVLIGAVCGAALGLGMLLVVLGMRGIPPVDHPPARRMSEQPHWLFRSAVASIAALIAFLVTGWPVGALLAGLVAAVLPSTLGRMRLEATSVAHTEAVAAWTEMLRDTLSAAAGLEEAIAATAEAAPEPIREEVERLGRRLERGSLPDALERFADELANPAADLVVAALLTAARREARELVPLLTALAVSARSEAEMRLRVHVSRARIRTAVRVVVGTLGIFAGGLLLFNRPYLAPYGTAVGQLVLFGVGAVFAAGWWLLQKMATIETPERFLARPAVGRWV
ncbi:MAG: type II secretion system F family protein [Actinobacteria bacterium]|jgi:Flp pilus assembly protein TadB|nr:type II secretion system F family protein [Actinomycetota bacterium]